VLVLSRVESTTQPLQLVHGHRDDGHRENDHQQELTPTAGWHLCDDPTLSHVSPVLYFLPQRLMPNYGESLQGLLSLASIVDFLRD